MRASASCLGRQFRRPAAPAGCQRPRGAHRQAGDEGVAADRPAFVAGIGQARGALGWQAFGQALLVRLFAVERGVAELPVRGRVDQQRVAAAAQVVQHARPRCGTGKRCGQRVDVQRRFQRGCTGLDDGGAVAAVPQAAAAGVDGLVLVASVAGGHTGQTAGFAFVEEVRQFWDGPIILGGAISTGHAIRAAELLGADLAYLGTALIASLESMAEQGYKDMIVSASAEDIVPSKGITGVTANWLRQSLVAEDYDLANMPEDKEPNFENAQDDAKAWKNVWSAGHGVGSVKDIKPIAQIVARLQQEYDAACLKPPFDVKE